MNNEENNNDVLKEESIKKKKNIWLIVIPILLVILLVVGYLFKDKIKDFFSKDNDDKKNNIVIPSFDDDVLKAYDKSKKYLGDNPCVSDDPYHYENGDYVYEYVNLEAESGYYEQYSVNETYIERDNGFYSGWMVSLKNNKKETINSRLCSSINNRAIISMSFLFGGLDSASIDVSSFDTSNVITTIGMFEDTKAQKIIGYENFDTSSVIDMTGMFENSNLEKIDISKYNTSNVKYMSTMFYNSKAKVINVSNINTSNVIDMAGMFAHTEANEIKGLDTFNTSNVINMSGMFAASKAKNILGYENFDTSKVEYIRGMFAYSNLENIDVSKYNSLALKDASYMFAFNNSKNINISNFKVPKENDTFELFFEGSANVIGGEKKTHDYVKLSEEEENAFFDIFKSIAKEDNKDNGYEVGYQNVEAEDDTFRVKEKMLLFRWSPDQLIIQMYRNKDNKYLLISETMWSTGLEGKNPYGGYYVNGNIFDISKINSGVVTFDGKKYFKWD